MRRQRAAFGSLVLLPAMALALAAATPASALSGYGISEVLRGGQPVLATKTQAGATRQRTCEKSREDKKPVSHLTAIDKLGRKFAPVACEQPPKSEVNLPSALNQASANAFASIG